MPDVSEISKARTELHAAIAGVVDAPWRVHRVTPTQVVAPTVWLDSVELSNVSDGGAVIVAATFPIYVVVDGAVRPQIETLDDTVALIWQTATRVGRPLDSRPISLDVGGPSLRAHVLRVEIHVLAQTLCPPVLILAGAP